MLDRHAAGAISVARRSFIDPGSPVSSRAEVSGASRAPSDLRPASSLVNINNFIGIVDAPATRASSTTPAERARRDGGPRPGRAVHDREAPAHGHVRGVPGARARGSWPYGITAGPDGNMWFVENFGPTDWQGSSLAGVVTEVAVNRRSASGDRPRAPTAISGSRSTPGNNIGRITPAGVVTRFPTPANRLPLRHRRGPRRQPLVHGVFRQQDRPGDDRPGSSRSSRSRALPPGSRGGPRRQPLVHRDQRQQDWSDHAGRA